MPQPVKTTMEIVGLFQTSEDLEQAISDLAGAGWDRAELSLLGAADLMADNDQAIRQRQSTTPAGRQVQGGQVQAGQIQAGQVQAGQAGAPQSPVVSKDDVRQMRTLSSGMAGVVAAFVAAGATVMSGGAALAAIIGAVAAGGGAAAAVEGLGHAADEKRERALRQQLETGGILLWALLRQPRDEATARAILERNGATEIRVQAAAAHRDAPLPLR